MKTACRILVLLAVLGGAAFAQTAEATGTGSAAASTAPGTPPAPAQGEPPAPPAASPSGAVNPTTPTPPPAAGAAAPAPAGPDACKLPAWICDLNNQPWDTGGNFWMPTPAAKGAEGSDYMFYAVLALSAFFFFAITFFIVYWTWKYRGRPGHKAQPSAAHNDVLEITWTVIPTIIVVFLFIGGWDNYIDMETRPAEPITIKVTAKKWAWDFEYPNGVHLENLVVPVDQPVELQMTSVDVIHSMYIPAFRAKQDVLPQRYTYIYVTPTRAGVYRVHCAEYCGMNHSQMNERAIVLDMAQWNRYLGEAKAALQNMDPKDLGKMVYDTKGCKGCHSVDGSRVVGPTWQGSWGTTIPLEGGATETMNEAYVKKSVTEPASEIHAGFPNAMPSYAGQLSEAEIHGVAAYIESLKK